MYNLKDMVFGTDDAKKMTLKHAIVNQREVNQINHHASEHT